MYGDPSRVHTVALLVPDQPMLMEIASKVGNNSVELWDLKNNSFLFSLKGQCHEMDVFFEGLNN